MTKSYWMHRISHCYGVSKVLLDQGYLSIGFSDFLESRKFYEDMIDETKSENEKWGVFEQENKDIWGGLKRTRHNLWRFLCKFAVDDIVIVPSTGTFSIYRIISKPQPVGDIIRNDFVDLYNKKIGTDGTFLRNDEGKVVDIGFVIKVELLAGNISRYKYAKRDLMRRLKLQNTNACLNDLQDEIEDAQQGKEIDVYADAQDVMTKALLKVLQKNLDDRKLELLVQWYFKNAGASYAEVLSRNPSGKKGYEDADVVAEFDDLKVIFYVQVKQHDGTTDKWAVTQINAYRELQEETRSSNLGNDYQQCCYWVISTCDNFDETAVVEAANNGVRLINGLEFSRMLINAGIKDINSAFDK